EIRVHGDERLDEVHALDGAIAIAPEDHVLEDGAQLTHVALPGATGERREEARVQLGYGNAGDIGDLGDQRLGDHLDVADPRAQGRKVDRGTAKAVEEVLSERTTARHVA